MADEKTRNEPSSPDLAALDDGWWGDGEDEEDEVEEEEEPEEAEPELPDERLDPVAYAEAKKARDERVEARRERRRSKAEAKKARRRARIEANRKKQKGKTRKSRTSIPSAKATSRRPATVRDAASDAPMDATSEAVAMATAEDLAPVRVRKPPIAVRRSRTNVWMLAIALGIFLAAAIFAAVVTR